MHIAILGLGYVGTTMAACLANDGHHVYGIDSKPEKVRLIGEGRSPVVEPEVAEMLRAGHAAGRVQARPALDRWLDQLDAVVVCVGTPSRADGKLDLTSLLEVTRRLGRLLAGRPAPAKPLLLIFRSTVPPGTMAKRVLPTLERAARTAPGATYEVAYNPEFLREATAVRDYYAPPKVVIGERFPGATRRLAGLYAGIEAPLFEVSFAIAEMVKLTDNAFHALKVAFANEIGRVALAQGVDPQAVADVFLADTKLNIAPAYLRPGGPFGGSCLPKDLAAMLALARDAGVPVPVLAGTKTSNAKHLVWLAEAIKARCPPPGPILMLGLSFKAGTDDLRNSPALALAERLLGAGYRLDVYDPDLDPERLIGVNFALALEHEAVLGSLLTNDLEGAAARARLIVLGKPMPNERERLPAEAPIVDIATLQGL